MEGGICFLTAYRSAENVVLFVFLVVPDQHSHFQRGYFSSFLQMAMIDGAESEMMVGPASYKGVVS